MMQASADAGIAAPIASSASSVSRSGERFARVIRVFPFFTDADTERDDAKSSFSVT